MHQTQTKQEQRLSVGINFAGASVSLCKKDSHLLAACGIGGSHAEEEAICRASQFIQQCLVVSAIRKELLPPWRSRLLDVPPQHLIGHIGRHKKTRHSSCMIRHSKKQGSVTCSTASVRAMTGQGLTGILVGRRVGLAGSPGARQDHCVRVQANESSIAWPPVVEVERLGSHAVQRVGVPVSPAGTLAHLRNTLSIGETVAAAGALAANLHDTPWTPTPADTMPMPCRHTCSPLSSSLLPPS